MSLTDYNHPLRHELTNELHSRPFLTIEAPARISYFVATHEPDGRPEIPHESVSALCYHLGIDAPAADENYLAQETDFGLFKWERHTEFSTYLFLETAPKGAPFNTAMFERAPQTWFANNPIEILSSAIIELQPRVDSVDRDMIEGYRQHFMPETFAVAGVLENAAYVMSDFRPDAHGHIRFVIQPVTGTGAKRIGRIVQRVIEIETYKTAALLALPAARMVSRHVPTMGRQLPPLLDRLHSGGDGVQQSFERLLELSSETEKMLADNDYRFSAAEAYSSIVDQRLSVLREQRVSGFQMMSEFLLRRFDPSVRTIKSSRQQLQDFSERVERASNLVRTQIDVNNANAQQDLLASMNKRAETQLRLQETVEGFSVVAISYYAVSLLSYLGAPIAKVLHIDKPLMLALAVPPTILLVWYFINRIKKRVAKH